MDYSNLTEEQKIEMFDLRKATHKVSSQIFKLEPNPGIVKYKTIHIGRKYKIDNPSHNGINGRVAEVTNFIYKKGQDEMTQVPLGVELKFMSNNKKGTYYDIIHLVEC